MDLTDAQWAVLDPLFRPRRRSDGRGRPWRDTRAVVNGVLWILRTGAPWRDLPERYGPWRTVASRFSRWQRAGRWGRLFAAGQAQAAAAGQINWQGHSVDGTMIRAHQHAAGAKKGLRRPKRSVAVKAASAPKSTSAPKVGANS